MKPAIKTTEFWFKLGVAVVGVFTALGLVSADEAKHFTTTWGELVNKIADLLPLLIPVWLAIMHGKRRTELKRTDVYANRIAPQVHRQDMAAAEADLLRRKLEALRAAKRR